MKKCKNAKNMKYYSTNGKAPIADLHKAVVKGLAEDRGLYMPERINKLPQEFFDNIEKMSFQEIAYTVASAFFGEDVDPDALHDIVYDTLAFDCAVVNVKDNIYTLELFHGPTLAFKDVGARFMARLLQYFIKQESGHKQVNVLVATSGDTGSAVANGFLGVEGIHVYVLYPKGIRIYILAKESAGYGVGNLLKTHFLDVVEKLLGQLVDTLGHIQSAIFSQSLYNCFVQVGNRSLAVGAIVLHIFDISLM